MRNNLEIIKLVVKYENNLISTLKEEYNLLILKRNKLIMLNVYDTI